MHPAGYPLSRVPLPPFPGGPHSQPYAIPTRGAVHGPVGAIPQVPQPGNRGFGAGRGNAGGPIGGHLPHQQSSQPLTGIGSVFNFPPLDNPSSQPSIGAPASQTGLMTQVRFFYYLYISSIHWLLFSMFYIYRYQMPVQGLSQTFRDGLSIGSMSQVLDAYELFVCFWFFIVNLEHS